VKVSISGGWASAAADAIVAARRQAPISEYLPMVCLRIFEHQINADNAGKFLPQL
jgi:hypothetical protein